MHTKNNTKVYIIPGIFFLMSWLFSCQQLLFPAADGAFSSPKDAVRPKILGYVTQSRGSNPIENSTITLAQENDPDTPILTTKTDSNGKFRFDDEPDNTIILEDGTYIITARKTGRASSSIIFPLKDGTSSVLSLQQFPLNFPDRPIASPIIAVNGIAPDDTITSDVEIQITVTVTSDNPLTENSSFNRIPINISLNKTGSANYDSFNVLYSDYNADHTEVELAYTIDPLSLPSGYIEMEIVSYDNNNNQSILIIPFTNEPEEYQRAPTPIIPPATHPKTYAQFITHNVSRNNNLYANNDNPDESISVQIYVTPNEHNGIKIYRTEDLEIAPQFIGSTSSIREKEENEQRVDYFYFEDLHPTIRSDTIYYYTLQYFNYDTRYKTINTSQFSDAIKVPILPKMTLYHTKPDNNTVYVSLPTCNEDDLIPAYCITFEWNTYTRSTTLVSSDIGPYIQYTDYLEIYWVRNYSTLLSTMVNSMPLSALENTYSYTYNFTDATYTLNENIRGKEYYWYITSSLSYTHTEKNRTNEAIYHIESHSYPDINNNISGEVKYGIAHNAGYYFTIQ